MSRVTFKSTPTLAQVRTLSDASKHPGYWNCPECGVQFKGLLRYHKRTKVHAVALRAITLRALGYVTTSYYTVFMDEAMTRAGIPRERAGEAVRVGMGLYTIRQRRWYPQWSLVVYGALNSVQADARMEHLAGIVAGLVWYNTRPDEQVGVLAVAGLELEAVALDRYVRARITDAGLAIGL